MSKTNQLSYVSKQNNISIELAIATISQSSVEEIYQALRKVPAILILKRKDNKVLCYN